MTNWKVNKNYDILIRRSRDDEGDNFVIIEMIRDDIFYSEEVSFGENVDALQYYIDSFDNNSATNFYTRAHRITI